MKTDRHFRTYLAQFFLECEVFQAKAIEVKAHVVCSATFFEKGAVYEIMWKLL
jgi:hypothetical protein